MKLKRIMKNKKHPSSKLTVFIGTFFCGLLTQSATTHATDEALFHPVEISQSRNSQLSLGGKHGIYSNTFGVWAWGENEHGQLGTGDKTSQTRAVFLKSLRSKKILQIAAGADHSCVLASDGVFCWGSNKVGQLGIGAPLSASAPSAPHELNQPNIKIKKIAAGQHHTCAVAEHTHSATDTIPAFSEDEVYCWGANAYGALGDGSGKEQRVPVLVKGLKKRKIQDITAGAYHTCAVADGKPYCWGENLASGNPEQLMLPTEIPGFKDEPVVSISAGFNHTCALTSGSQVYCWGSRADGILPSNPIYQAELATLGVSQISSGNDFTCAVTAAGTYCWGTNNKGQLGITLEQRRTGHLIKVDLDSIGIKAAQVASGDGRTCAATEDSVYCWGAMFAKEESLTFGTNIRKLYLQDPKMQYRPNPAKTDRPASKQIDALETGINGGKDRKKQKVVGTSAFRKRIIELAHENKLVVNKEMDWRNFKLFVGQAGTRKDVVYRIFPQAILFAHNAPISTRIDDPSTGIHQDINFFQSSSTITPKLEIVHWAWRGSEESKKDNDLIADAIPLLLFRMPDSAYGKDILAGLIHLETIGISLKSLVPFMPKVKAVIKNQETGKPIPKKFAAVEKGLPLTVEKAPEGFDDLLSKSEATLVRLKKMVSKRASFSVALNSPEYSAQQVPMLSGNGALKIQESLKSFKFGENQKDSFGFYLQGIEKAHKQASNCLNYSVIYGAAKNYSSTITLCNSTGEALGGDFSFPVKDIYLNTATVFPSEEAENTEALIIVDFGDDKILMTTATILERMTEGEAEVDDFIFEDTFQEGRTLKTKFKQFKAKYFPKKAPKEDVEVEVNF